MTTLLDNELDNELCEKARRLGEHTTQAEVIHQALEVYVYYLQKRANIVSQQLGILEEFGQIDYYDDYDYKKLRHFKRTG